jgi:hypothetical protein
MIELLPILFATETATGPVQVVSDSFNRADSPGVLGTSDTGQVWTAQQGIWGIDGDKAQSSSTLNAFATLDAGVGDYTVSATITNSLWTGNTAGLVFRISGSNVGLVLVMNDSYMELCKLSKTRFGVNITLLAFVPLATVNDTDYVLKVVSLGNILQCYRDGALRIAYTLTGDDATAFDNTKTGVGLYGDQYDTVRYDNFVVEV